MTNVVLKVAAKAVIVNDDGKVLILREALTYKEGTNIGRYHCPGGRLNIGESYDDGLRREVMEETGLIIEPLYPIYVGEWYPNIRGTRYQIIAIFTVCRANSNRVKLSEEHDKFLWIDPKKQNEYDIIEPENKVLIRYKKWLSGKVS